MPAIDISSFRKPSIMINIILDGVSKPSANFIAFAVLDNTIASSDYYEILFIDKYCRYFAWCHYHILDEITWHLFLRSVAS